MSGPTLSGTTHWEWGLDEVEGGDSNVGESVAIGEEENPSVGQVVPPHDLYLSSVEFCDGASVDRLGTEHVGYLLH